MFVRINARCTGSNEQTSQWCSRCSQYLCCYLLQAVQEVVVVVVCVLELEPPPQQQQAQVQRQIQDQLIRQLPLLEESEYNTRSTAGMLLMCFQSCFCYKSGGLIYHYVTTPLLSMYYTNNVSLFNAFVCGQLILCCLHLQHSSHHACLAGFVFLQMCWKSF